MRPFQFANGNHNPDLAGYKVARFADTPAFETNCLVNRSRLRRLAADQKHHIIGIAPAIGNAIFQVTGIRLRSLQWSRMGWRAEGEWVKLIN